MATLQEVLATLTTLRDNLDEERRITNRVGIGRRGEVGMSPKRFKTRTDLVDQAIEQINSLSAENTSLSSSNSSYESQISSLQSQVSSLQQQLAACQAQLP